MDDLVEITALGKRMHSQSFVLRGRMADSDWKLFLAEVTKEMGMTPVCEAAVWNYPIDGKGGSGMTAFQPITESFIALDTWSSHNGAYLFIASCRKFDATQLFKTIRNWSLGLEDMSGSTALRL